VAWWSMTNTCKAAVSAFSYLPYLVLFWQSEVEAYELGTPN